MVFAVAGCLHKQFGNMNHNKLPSLASPHHANMCQPQDAIPACGCLPQVAVIVLTAVSEKSNQPPDAQQLQQPGFIFLPSLMYFFSDACFLSILPQVSVRPSSPYHISQLHFKEKELPIICEV